MAINSWSHARLINSLGILSEIHCENLRTGSFIGHPDHQNPTLIITMKEIPLKDVVNCYQDCYMHIFCAVLFYSGSFV